MRPERGTGTTTRREFTLGLIGGGAALGVARQARAAGAPQAPVPAAQADAAPRAGVAGFGSRAVPQGELAERIALTAARLSDGGRPAYTREFVLADVALDRRRRFSEFSGDLSGRYVEALSVLPPANGPDLHSLLAELLAHQRGDGRFGDAALRFSAAEIGPPHMALLWGNGRLLVGLLQFHAATADARTLAAARRLADFLVGVREQAADPAVAQRVAGQGAFGIICFTQLIEPLVALSRVTGNGRYLDAARRIAPSLGPRGIQHAHGYLTTLRGLLDLANATGDPADLARVERLYADLAASPDLCWMGGVLEYFGWEDPSVSAEQRKALLAASGTDPRDEGCGVADFLRLSLALGHATGKSDYLERAERCLLNHLYFNQFTTGDFGSRSFFRGGTKPTENVDRAWWCCTMHGYRAFADVLASAVRVKAGVTRIELFVDADWTGEGLELALRQRALSPLQSRLDVEVRAAAGTPLALRKPAWADGVSLVVNGRPGRLVDSGDSLAPERPPRAGDRLELTFDHAVRVETRDRRRLALRDLRGETEGLLFVGPWLYTVDDGLEPLFFGEPWLAGNVVTLAARPQATPATASTSALLQPARQLAAQYEHAGFVGTHPLRLRPVAEQAAREPGIVAAWLRYRS